MGILDDAIKEHLELKRQHGAGDDELKQLENEAFGAAERPGDEGPPDPLAEAPTEFMAQPEVEEPSSRPAPRAEIADLQEAPPSSAEESPPEPEVPAEEESPAMEHEAVAEPTPEPEPEAAPEPEVPSGPSTAEREAIAEQPTEMYDLEEELGSPEDKAPAVEEEYEEDDDFWDEKRLSDELDQALEAPSEVEVVEEEDVEYEDEPEAKEEETPAGGEEDVLEETPDFLEETPEDDQLWFEQKPPKDFDFDD
jgi:hypothetical protein